jgi:hypothetical protein
MLSAGAFVAGRIIFAIVINARYAAGVDVEV